jgi:hypothetical protein
MCRTGGVSIASIAGSSSTRSYREGSLALHMHSMKCPRRRPEQHGDGAARDVPRPASAELTVCRDMPGGGRVDADLGGGRFRAGRRTGGFFVAAPDFANTVAVDGEHGIRASSFPVARWQDTIDEASDGAARPGGHAGAASGRRRQLRPGRTGFATEPRFPRDPRLPAFPTARVRRGAETPARRPTPWGDGHKREHPLRRAGQGGNGCLPRAPHTRDSPGVPRNDQGPSR